MDIEATAKALEDLPCDRPVYLVQLQKLSEVPAPFMPYNIPVGYQACGFVLKEQMPEVGKCFYVNGTSRGTFRTSEVQEVIDEQTFRTYNSVYLLHLYEEGLHDGYYKYERKAIIAEPLPLPHRSMGE